MWKAYVDYLDDMVVDGFFNCIQCSLNYMLENTDTRTCNSPLFEARLELQVCFTEISLVVVAYFANVVFSVVI